MHVCSCVCVFVHGFSHVRGKWQAWCHRMHTYIHTYLNGTFGVILHVCMHFASLAIMHVMHVCMHAMHVCMHVVMHVCTMHAMHVCMHVASLARLWSSHRMSHAFEVCMYVFYDTVFVPMYVCVCVFLSCT
jgi:hypothetical protein